MSAADIKPLREVVKDLVWEALIETYGNKKQSAALLGVTTRTIENKMREYGITLEQVRRLRTERARQQKLFTKNFRTI